MARLKKSTSLQQPLLFQDVDKGRVTERFAQRYRMHQYWARKPWYVVREYLMKYTSPGDTVLDPFIGSGVTACEALTLRRKIIWRDINPIASLITRTVCVSPIDIQDFQRRALSILSQLQTEVGDMYLSTCPKCGRDAELINALWQGENLQRVYLRCLACCETTLKNADAHDLEVARSVSTKQVKSEEIYRHPLPADSDVDCLGELYTPRNWYALATLYDLVGSEGNDEIASLLKLMFCATASRVSRMNFINKHRLARGNNPAGVWGEKRFWVPRESIENSVTYYFSERISKIVKAKQETNHLIGNFYEDGGTFCGCIGSATDLELPSGTVDYCFTDPPYGGSVKYLALSIIWNAWLGCEADASKEIVIDRNRSLAEYGRMLEDAMRQIHRALKPGRHLSVTFHSGDSSVWRAMLTACDAAGFSLCGASSEEPLKRSHNQLEMAGRVTTDFVLTFRKEASIRTQANEKATPSILDIVKQEASQLIAEAGCATTAEIYDRFILAWLNGSGGRPRNGDLEISMKSLVTMLRRLGFTEGVEVKYDYKGVSREVRNWS